MTWNSIITASSVRNGGIRRYQNEDGTLTAEGKARLKSDSKFREKYEKQQKAKEDPNYERNQKIKKGAIIAGSVLAVVGAVVVADIATDHKYSYKLGVDAIYNSYNKKHNESVGQMYKIHDMANERKKIGNRSYYVNDEATRKRIIDVATQHHWDNESYITKEMNKRYATLDHLFGKDKKR